ncbi:MAG: hypothetical protein HKP55_15195 [Gammaproteobacteria bacterium]|nr:hypothetical protein [Gammaproteobacteria bacterium]
MTSLTIQIDFTANLALEVVKHILAENEKSSKIPEDNIAGPVFIANALADFFDTAAGIEQQDMQLEPDAISDFGHQGLDLLDRVSWQIRQLDIHDERDRVASIYASLAVWLARRGAVIENMETVADSFAIIVNSENDSGELVNLCRLMEETLQAASEPIKKDEDRSDPWRPWRVLNLNTGIAATRSLDAELMKQVFAELEKRLPEDVSGFFADGKRQMDTQDVPQEVRDVLDEYVKKWPAIPAGTKIDFKNLQ